MTAGDVAVSRASSYRVYGADVTILAARQARALLTRRYRLVAGLAGIHSAIAAEGGAVAVGAVVASSWAAAVAAFAFRDYLMTAGRIAVSRASGHSVYCTHISIVAARRTQARRIAGLASIQNSVVATG